VHAFVSANPTCADLEEADDFIAQGVKSSNGGDGMAANLRSGDDSRLSFRYDTGQFAAIKLALGDDLRAFVSQIDCPKKVLRGARSKVISPDAAAQLAGLIPGATWAQVPDAGHTIQSSNPIRSGRRDHPVSCSRQQTDADRVGELLTQVRDA
jgi:esterase